MNLEWILEEAKTIFPNVVRERRYVHSLAEVGFELYETRDFIERELSSFGLLPARLGRCGVVTTIKGQAPPPIGSSDNKDEKRIAKVTQFGKFFRENKNCVLLRADADALPIEEKTSLPFSSKGSSMHACGHDMHTAMLLGCAKILSRNTDKFSGEIKLAFQPAEEILSGAKDMVECGLLKKPEVKCAAMIHVVPATNFATGSIFLPPYGISAPSAEFFKITVFGKSAHGASPSVGADASVAGCKIVGAIDSMLAHEIVGGNAKLTIGKIVSGSAPNIISDRCEIWGSLRSVDEKTKAYLKTRLKLLSEQTARAHKCIASLEFTSGCPALKNSVKITKKVEECLNLLYKSLTNASIIPPNTNGVSATLASEDFSYISRLVPSVCLGISAGSIKGGYKHPLHHPSVTFDEDALLYGMATYTALGIYLLNK